METAPFFKQELCLYFTYNNVTCNGEKEKGSYPYFPQLQFRQLLLLSWRAIVNGLFDRPVNLFGREKNNGLDIDRSAGVDH